MLITCPRCQKQHSIDEQQIPPQIKMARCKYCDHKFPLHIIKYSGDQTPEQIRRPRQKTKKIGICLSKGGVGKTTTAVNLSAGLAFAGYKVLLVDTDTQGQVSLLLGIKATAGLTELVTGDASAADALIQARENLWLLTGGKSLAGIKRFIDRKDFGGEMTLSESLSPLDDQFDYIIIDTSPGWDTLTVNVLFYVNEVLAPVSLEVMTVQGLVEFMKSIASIRKYRKNIDLKYILPTFLDNRVKQSATILNKLKELYGERICTPIRYNVRLSEAPAFGQSIYNFAPGSKGAHDYRELVKKITGNKDLFQSKRSPAPKLEAGRASGIEGL